MSKSAVAKASTIVYFGPSDTLYCRVGSIDANETVEVHAKELNYYYITYTAGSTKKRGFVPVGQCGRGGQGEQDHFCAMNDRFRPGARFSAIIAASMQMVPEPQNGSQKKSRPR